MTTLDFVAMVSRLPKDSECPDCLGDPGEPNPNCADHRDFILENDDAFDTLHSLITQARIIIQRLKKETGK